MSKNDFGPNPSGFTDEFVLGKSTIKFGNRKKKRKGKKKKKK